MLRLKHILHLQVVPNVVTGEVFALTIRVTVTMVMMCTQIVVSCYIIVYIRQRKKERHTIL